MPALSPIPVSLQLWSIRDLVKKDFAATVAELARLGFTGVETAGYGNLEPATAARALAAAGLQCSGMHVPMEDLRRDPGQVAVDACLLGARHVICPYCPRELFRSATACQRIGEELNGIGEALRSYGLTFHYHHHDFELMMVEGRPGLDWLLDASEPRNVLCEADVYWLHTGGKPPARFIEEQGRRIRLLHLKDEKELGTGPVDFPAVFAAADRIQAVEWLVIEVEKYSYAPLESVARSLSQLKAWGRA